MTESNTTTPTAALRWRQPVLIAGGVLLASLAGAAGWLARGEPPVAAPPAAAVAQLAPPAAGNKLIDDEVAPPARETQPAPAVQEPEPKPQSKPAPVRKTPRATTAQGSGNRAAPACANCGVVASVTEVHRKGDANGVGAVAGGVIGGLLGNQVGGGNGKKAMTVVGVVGGGLAGHEIEKRARGDVVYQVVVRMENGSTRTVTVKDKPVNGARVVVEGQSLRAAP